MSLDELIDKLKGGPGSGNWGHAGRPGTIGGSAPRSGVGAAMSLRTGPSAKARQAEAAGKVDKKKGKKLELKEPKPHETLGGSDLEEMLDDPVGRQVLSYVNALEEYEDSGLTFKVYSIEGPEYDQGYKVSADIQTLDGTPAGTLVRTFSKFGDEVHNDYFVINDYGTNLRGKGFGAKFYKASEEAYKEMGFEKVTIEANISVGGYAWARMGYDFDTSRGDYYKQEVQKSFVNTYKNRYGTLPTALPQSASEMAAFTGDDGYKVGKNAMLGSYWLAVKYLDESSPSWQAGQAYYASKGLN